MPGADEGEVLLRNLGAHLHVAALGQPEQGAGEPGPTIWPTSTLRARIRPVVGAITLSWPIWARVAPSWACATRTWAFAASRVARLESISALDTKPRP